MWKYLTVHMAKLLGDTDPPKCPAPWLNLPKLLELCNNIVDSLDTVETKEEFCGSHLELGKLRKQTEQVFSLVFPWHLGLSFPRRGQEEINEMVRLSRIWEKQ